MLRQATALLTLLALTFAMPEAQAQSLADEAELHFDMGVDAYQRGKYEDALMHFMQSNRLSPNALVASNVGHANTALKRYPDAYRWYSLAKVLSGDGGSESLVSAMAHIEPNVVLFQFDSDPPGATLFVDKVSLGAVATAPATIALPAGVHRFIVELQDHHSQTFDAVSYPEVGTTHIVAATLVAITGKLTVTGVTATEVRLGTEDGELLCTVPCDTNVPIGQQLLHLSKTGFHTQTSLVNVIEGELTEVQADLNVVTGTLRIDAIVADALVTIDGEAAGFTPTIVHPPVGTRTVVVAAQGYESQTIEVEILDGEVIDLGVLRMQPRQLVSLASRVKEDIFTAPSSISVITRKEMDAFGYPTITDALRGVRGLTVINGDLGSMAMVRGVGTAANRGSQTKVLQDGVSMSDQLTGQQYIWSRTQNLAQIEVQRGSGSVLYGGGALTGVISLQTRGRVTDSGAEASVGTFGSEGRANGRMAWAGSGAEDVGASVYIGVVHGEGDSAVIRDFETTRPDGSDGVTDEEVIVAHYSPWQSQMVDARFWAGDFDLIASYASDSVHVTSGSEGSLYEDPRNPANNPTTLDQLTVKAEYRPVLSDRTDLELSAHYREIVSDSKALWSRTAADSELLIDVRQHTQAKWVGGVAQLVTNPTDTLRIVAGSEAYRSVALSLDQRNTIRPSDAAARSGFESAQAVYAAYGVVDYAPVPLVKLSAGVRLDSWYEFGLQANPRLVGMLLPTDDDAIKLMVGRAFRAPVVYEQKYFVESISIPALDLKPESGWSYEAEYSHREGSWTGIVSGWGVSYTDTIVSTFDPAITLARYQNAGSSEVVGADAELRREFLGGWMFSGWYSYQLPTTTTTDNVASGSPEQPHHLSAVKLVAPIVQPGISAAIRLVYEGERPHRQGTQGEVDDAVLADFVLSGRSRDTAVEWRAGVYNALDTNFSAATTNSTPSATVPQTFGRTFMASITLHAKKTNKTGQ